MWRKLRTLFKQAPVGLSSLSAYALWAENYPPYPHNALMQAEEHAMRAMLPALTGHSVLDLACGSGRYAQIAAAGGATHCVAVDNSAAMLAAARAHTGSTGIRYALGDTRRIPLRSACMDVVLCGLAIGHVAHLDESLAEIARVLRVGGVALISDFHPFLFLDGKQRTFAAPDGRVYAVEHHVHLYSDIHATASRHGLSITAIAEPRLPVNGRDLPAVIVYRMQRT